jgi:phenylacetic acid degradation operon negative regulatory protein
LSEQASQRPVTRPNSFIFTLYGDMVHRRAGDGALWIGGLIRLMGSFGVSPQAVRQAVYMVTARGRRRIEELSPRIYGPVIEWDGRWRLLSCAGETQRHARERLRKELAALGWAQLSSSTWISPSDTLEAAREAAGATVALEAIHLFEAEYRGPLTDRALLERCWNVDEIASAYREFISRYRARFNLEIASGELSDEGAFAERLWLVHDYRKFAYLDPGLPSELLPAHWPGTAAAALFREYYAALEKKSQRYFHLCARLTNGAERKSVEASRPCPNA